MSSLQEFAREADLAAQSEVERVRRLTYFLSTTSQQSEVQFAAVMAALGALHLPQPNASRLRGKLTLANGFVKASAVGYVKLHFKKLREYEDLYPGLKEHDGIKYKVGTVDGRYVSRSRIEELAEINSASFDLQKLVALLKELNICAVADCYFSVAMLVRSILAHVPPIFGQRTFNEVANNAAGTKSFKDSMRHLNEGARKIADAHLHIPIRSHEVLPNERQVDFSQSLDVLLAEVVRLLRQR